MKISDQQAIILERLIEAMETDNALPMSIGPRKFGTAMPDYLQTEAEYFVLEREDWTDRRRYLTRQRRNERHRAAERRAKCTSERITRMELAFDWVIDWIWDEDTRKCLLAYAKVKALGWDWNRYVSARNRKNPRKKAWVRQNTYRWIAKSLQIIEQQIAKAGFFLNNEGDLQVRQITAELGCKSITSVSHVWREDEKIRA